STIISIFSPYYSVPRYLHPFPTRRSSDLPQPPRSGTVPGVVVGARQFIPDHSDVDALRAAVRGCRGCDLYRDTTQAVFSRGRVRSEEHTSELQSRENLVCRLLLEKKKA